MRSRFNHSSRGFSLTEMLVVIALIGVFSLISVPAFINMRNQSTFRADLNTFATDLRSARSYAISHTVDVRVELDAPGNSLTSNTYRFYSSVDRGTTWTALTMPGAHGIGPGTQGNIKSIAGPVWIQSQTGLPDLPIATPDGKPDIVYHPNGGMDLAVNATSATVVLRCAWKRIAYDTFTIGLSASGQFNSTSSHT